MSLIKITQNKTKDENQRNVLFPLDNRHFITVFEDENEHQLFNYYIETHWCNKDEYKDKGYIVFIPEVIGYDLSFFKEQLINIHILQNMLIEFRKENEFKVNKIQL